MAGYQCYLLLVALTLFVFIQMVTPLRCFVCTTRDDGQYCEDPFNKTERHADSCDIPSMVCVKRVVSATERYNESIQRSCVVDNYCDLYKQGASHCSTCKMDDCNSSITVLPSSFGVLALLSSFCYAAYVNLIT